MVLALDTFPENSDWTKASWDIPARDETELLDYLSSFQMTLEHFRTLPVYAWNAPHMPWLAKARSAKEIFDDQAA